MSVVVHEVAHGYAALALGDQTAKYEGRLTLNPISHLDPLGSVVVPLLGYLFGGIIIGWARPVPFNPYNLRNQKWGEALVAAAGPAANIALAVVFGLLIRSGIALSLGPAAAGLITYIILINITLAVFNLVPIPPLDGSKIFFALLPYKYYYIRQTIEAMGVVLVLVVVFFFWQFLSPIIGHIFKLFTGLNAF